MSLTFLKHKQNGDVAIVYWFKDPKFSVTYPCGPIVRLSAEEFRAGGMRLVKDWCRRYGSEKLDEKDVVPAFEPDEEKAFLRNFIPISLFVEADGGVTLAPMRFRRLALGGLTTLGPESFRRLPTQFGESEFWSAFDDVMQEAG